MQGHLVGTSRRGLMGAGLIGLAGAATPLLAATRAPTPRETTGPFYPEPAGTDGFADLMTTPGASARAAGRPTEVRIKVVDINGKPVPSAMMLIWQANAAGRYAHSRDTSAVPLDPNFRGHAMVRADGDGALRLVTVRPGAYRTPDGNQRTPHLHVEAVGAKSQLVTQMYFAGEPLNEQDLLIRRMKSKGDNPALMVAAATKPTLDGIEEAWDWTLVLAKG
jgi:protocatechuate 3,4-dioxygenase beta subunit